MKFYITLQDSADRPYITARMPPKERQAELIKQGCELFEVDVELPGWEWKHGKVCAVAKAVKVD